MSGMKPFNWSEVRRIFLTSRAEPCPYLPERQEQKLVTLLRPDDLQGYAHLTARGFRRSHDAAYHPACPACQACQALRVKATAFRPNKTQRRLKNLYKNLHISICDNLIDSEHWLLFTRYVQGRHAGGNMAHMTRADFDAMVRDSPVTTRLIEWREGPEGPLVAACLTDMLPDGPSAVYSYFSLSPDRPSLGTFMILSLIDLAVKAKLPHVHLGYWVKGSPKMDYKAKFQPAEVCIGGQWQPLCP